MPACVKQAVISPILSTFPTSSQMERKGSVSESCWSIPALQPAVWLLYLLESPLNKSQATWPSLKYARAPSGRPPLPHSVQFQWQMLCLSSASQQQQQRKSVACSLATGPPSIIWPVMVASPTVSDCDIYRVPPSFCNPHVSKLIINI